MAGQNAGNFEKPVEDFLGQIEGKLGQIGGFGGQLEGLKEKYRAELVGGYGGVEGEAGVDSDGLYYGGRMGGRDRRGERLEGLGRVGVKDLEVEFREKVKGGRRMVFEYVREVDGKVKVREEELWSGGEIVVVEVG